MKLPFYEIILSPFRPVVWLMLTTSGVRYSKPENTHRWGCVYSDVSRDNLLNQHMFISEKIAGLSNKMELHSIVNKHDGKSAQK